MPALKKTEYFGEILWLGRVESRANALRSTSVQEIKAGFDGLDGEDHGGLTRPSCSRVISQYPRDTEIRNTRQICIVSAEEMAAVASEIGIENFDPAWCGANIVIKGIPDFTHIPPASRLQTQNGTTLTVDIENRPCHLPAPVIEEDAPGHGRGFKLAAKDRRGVTGWVEREGMLRVGDIVTLHIPDQRSWKLSEG